MTLQEAKDFKAVDPTQGKDGFDRISMTLLRVWEFVTGLGNELDERRWDCFLSWPPDVFALCAIVLKRSGCYSVALENEDCSRAGARARTMRDKWCIALGKTLPRIDRVPIGLPVELIEKWRDLWACRGLPLSRVVDCGPLMETFVFITALADEACEGSGLPIQQEVGDDEGQLPRSRFVLIRKGWDFLEPTRYGSTLCSGRIHPNAGRVLPKMHTPQCGLTARSLTLFLAFCESDEVQPRWFMVPGMRGNPENRHHINLLVIPWPAKVDPSQFDQSKGGNNPGEKFFDYSIQPSANLADRIDELCDESLKILGSLDGVVLPELALSLNEYETVREKVLRRGLLFIAGVGEPAGGSRKGSNQVCIDIPLSTKHAIHFRQAKHHRWHLDRSQIINYGIGARLNPNDAYWENIEIGDRKLLFLVLRPWLVTSVLVCEDLARHDPVGELLRGVGPQLVIALLMDGPQLASRWPGRYAATLADDPGSSVISVSSQGMVGLSRPYPIKDPSRIVVLWKDARQGVKELAIPAGADALALTISVEYGREFSADGRGEVDNAEFPVLTGVHPVTRAERTGRPTDTVAPINFLAPHEAGTFARLVQTDARELSPELILGLTGEARGIGEEIWRQETNFPTKEQWEAALTKPEAFANLPTSSQRETAQQIRTWKMTNIVVGRAAHSAHNGGIVEQESGLAP